MGLFVVKYIHIQVNGQVMDLSIAITIQNRFNNNITAREQYNLWFMLGLTVLRMRQTTRLY